MLLFTPDDKKKWHCIFAEKKCNFKWFKLPTNIFAGIDICFMIFTIMVKLTQFSEKDVHDAMGLSKK